MGRDISCNLGSTNVANLMDSPDFGKSVRTMAEALNYVAESADIDVVPAIKDGNSRARAYGLGAMNLHGFLAKEEIHYGSREALDFTNVYFMLLNYHTLWASTLKAKEHGEAFDTFEGSSYEDGSYFDGYIADPVAPITDRVEELFASHTIPTAADWQQLMDHVQQFGLYNQNRLAVAPNGSISYLQEATSSILPVNALIEERLEGMTGKTYYPAPYLNNDNGDYFVPSTHMDMRKVIDTYAVAQRHVDQGMSLTLSIKSDTNSEIYDWKKGTEHENTMTSRDLTLLRLYAWKRGIKTLYYVRNVSEGDDANSPDQALCEACAI